MFGSFAVSINIYENMQISLVTFGMCIASWDTVSLRDVKGHACWNVTCKNILHATEIVVWYGKKINMLEYKEIESKMQKSFANQKIN